MNTGLGLDFLRVVNDEGSNGWSQVFSRMPFDETELKEKGALLGCVFSPDLENWAEKESSMMEWIEEFFNGQISGNHLGDFLTKFLEKYPGMEFVWVWCNLEEGKRITRIVRSANGKIVLWRDGKRVDVDLLLEPEKILKGVVQDEDRLMIWSGPLDQELEKIESSSDRQSLLSQVSDSMREQKIAVSGLYFDFGKWNDEKLNKDIEVVTTEQGVEESQELEQPKEEKRINSPYFSDFKLNDRPAINDLVSNKLVGRLGPKEKLSNWWNDLRTGNKKELVVGRQPNKKKTMTMVVGAIFLVLLVVSVVTGTIKANADKENKRWTEFSEPILKKIADAQSMASVNLVGSRKMMEEARQDLQNGKLGFGDLKYAARLSELDEKINAAWNLASGEKQSQLENQVDLKLTREGFSGTRLSLVSDQTFVALDPVMGVVFSVNGTSKDIKVIAGKGESLAWKDVMSDGKKTYLLDQQGVSQVGKEVKSITFDDAVAGPLVLGRFGNNIYLLDQINKEIYRYGVSGEAYGDRVRWLKSGQSIGFEKPSDLAIDIDIWVVGGTAEVEKYRKGARENFSLNGAPESLKFSRIAVSSSTDMVALLDVDSGVVAYFKKSDGNFVQQLKSESLKTATDIEFDDQGNLWVLNKGVMGILK